MSKYPLRALSTILDASMTCACSAAAARIMTQACVYQLHTVR
jgi:hypothetical protein